MADERLAELVRSYPILYDKSLVDFKNPRKKELERSEIARELSLKSGNNNNNTSYIAHLSITMISALRIKI